MPLPMHMMQSFQDALVDCELDGMGFTVDPFTWQRRRLRDVLIEHSVMANLMAFSRMIG